MCALTTAMWASLGDVVLPTLFPDAVRVTFIVRWRGVFGAIWPVA